MCNTTMDNNLYPLHMDQVFDSVAIYLSGHAYVGCRFLRCSVIVTNAGFYANDCEFLDCNFHLNYDLVSGDDFSLDKLQEILDSLVKVST